MKINLITCCLIIVPLLFTGCHNKRTSGSSESKDTGYDSIMAKELGADPYGMKSYVIAFLYRGPNRETDSLKAAGLQKAHLENIVRLSEKGFMVLAGPFISDGDLRGIYIFDTDNIATADSLTRTDPAIQSGHLRMELMLWYGSAAINLIPDLQKRITERSFAE